MSFRVTILLFILVVVTKVSCGNSKRIAVKKISKTDCVNIYMKCTLSKLNCRDQYVQCLMPVLNDKENDDVSRSEEEKCWNVVKENNDSCHGTIRSKQHQPLCEEELKQCMNKFSELYFI